MASSTWCVSPEKVITETVQCGEGFGILATNTFINSGLYENKRLRNFINDINIHLESCTEM